MAWRTTPVDMVFPKSVLPPPLPKGCGGGGTPISYNNETCCVKGYVYVNGDPVSGAVVKIGYGGHEVTATTSEVDSGGRGYYTTSLNDAPLSVPVGGSVVITASYGGVTKTVTTTALMGSQQVDVALPGGSNSQPVATIRKMTPADAKQGADTISFYGVGQDADGTDVIGQYEWVIAHGTANFSVTSAVSNFVLPADSLTWPGVYTVSLRVKDDEGTWSGVVQQRLWVRNPEGGITSGDTWTILIYADGDNNLDGWLGDYVGGMARRLKEAQGLSNVNVYMWYDGPGVGDSYEFVKYASGGFSTAPVGGGELRMDEKGTLVNFARAGMIKFSSDHTMLIVADHANGVVGISQDDSTDGNGRAFLTPIELRKGIQEITEDGSKKLDIVLFDGCSFGQFEDIATMDGQAYYVIASPNTGWGVFPYERYRELASAAPTPRALAQAMAQRYVVEVSSYGLPYTVAAYDLSRFGAAKQAIGTLGTALITYINGDPVTRRPQVSGLRTQAQKYDSFDSQPYQPDNEDSYVDIGDFSRLVAQNIGDSGVVSAAIGVTNVLSGGSLPLIMYKSGASGYVSRQNSEYGGAQTIQVDLSKYGGLGIFYPPRTSSSTTSAYYNYVRNQLFHITWNWGWTSFIATGPVSLGGDPLPMPGNVLMAPLIPCGDTAEPNNSISAARAITVGVEEGRLAICAAGDEDWFEFGAQGGGRYVMETYSLTVGMDTVMWVYDGSGALIGSDDNGNAGVSAGGSRVERVLGNGRYYVKVAHTSASAGNVTLKYAMRVSVSQPPKQVFVPSTFKLFPAAW